MNKDDSWWKLFDFNIFEVKIVLRVTSEVCRQTILKMEIEAVKAPEEPNKTEEPVDTTVVASTPEKKKRKKSRKKAKAKGLQMPSGKYFLLFCLLLVSGFPKFYKNGYVRFCDEMRPLVCGESPAMDPVEVTKLVAAKWYGLKQEEKQPYMDEAKLDKDRFKRELKEFQRNKPEEGEPDQSATKKLKVKRENKNIHPNGVCNDAKTSNSNYTAEHGLKRDDDVPKTNMIFRGTNCELPIFTEHFLEHNKIIESELKLLRKNNVEIEQQNSVLMKHIENMENGVKKVEGEISATKEQNVRLEKYLTKVKIILASGLHSLTLPSLKSGATVENIEKYMTDMASEASAQKSPGVVNKAREILRKMDIK